MEAKQTITLMETGNAIVAYHSGSAIGSASVSDYVMRARGRRSSWAVSVKFSERGGNGYTKAEARSRLKELVRRHYGAVKFETK